MKNDHAFHTRVSTLNIVNPADGLIKVLDSSGFHVGELVRNTRTSEIMQIIDIIDSEDVIEVERAIGSAGKGIPEIHHGDVLIVLGIADE